MKNLKNMKIVTIIPAYNEEKRIGLVIDSVNDCSLVNEVFVVDDGSTDKTTEIATQKGATVIELDENVGKGGAMQKGIEKALDTDLIAFIDADLIGFKPNHLEDMINPFLNDPELQMTVGKFTGGRTATDLSQYLVPQISGQRVVTRQFLEGFPDLTKTRFGVEVAINNYARKTKAKVKEILLENVSHVMKEEKLGLRKGFIARIKMYNEMVVYLMRKKKH
jgi:cellulose synthase/poly-beta-1,6-N-acetylglucosamine synthase-like glycosyltransferase